ncbi:signal peptide peptidase SppA [Deltaproteobacteria bacterium Smac51]|nr:signal peptide peptidase SppA [Deltaproteobacteria bacterium Smac51]
MRPEDWQAYQAGRSAGASPTGGSAASPPPSQPYMNAPLPRPPRRGMGWPMAFLLLGLAMIGGCCYSIGYMVDSWGPSIRGTGATEPSVGVLVVEDEIFGSIWATDTITRFADDPNIKSIVVRINSPGGSVAPCQEIYNSLKDLNKPIVVSMGSVAASGGLYIAAAGDVIVANPGTITGSIGVIMQSIEVTGTMEKLGLKSEVIKSGEFKDMGSPFRPLKNNERELLQRMVMEVYEQFVADLTAGRKNMDAATVRRLADGRIYSGSDAHRLGLVDELGGFEYAVAIAAKRGGLPAGVRPTLVIEDGRRPWWETVMESKSAVNLAIPPALTPGFSLKYLYQPEITN